MANDSTGVLYVRDLPVRTRERIQVNAAARGMKVPDYLERLVRLHDAARARADSGDEGIATDLESLGLQSVIR